MINAGARRSRWRLVVMNDGTQSRTLRLSSVLFCVISYVELLSAALASWLLLAKDRLNTWLHCLVRGSTGTGAGWSPSLPPRPDALPLSGVSFISRSLGASLNVDGAIK